MKTVIITLALCFSAGLIFGQDIQQFEKDFKAALKKKKKEKVAEFFVDPLFSMDWGYIVPVENEDERTGEITNEQLVEHYKLFFTKDLVKEVLANPLVDGKDLYSEGTWMLRYMKTDQESAWFVISIVDGKYKITGTDNVSQ